MVNRRSSKGNGWTVDMQYKIRWLRQAGEDLQNIRQYLDQEAPQQAQEIVGLIYDKTMALTSFPAGRGQREPGKPEYRRLVILNIYKVFYFIDEHEKTVEIRYIRHTSQGDTSDILEG